MHLSIRDAPITNDDDNGVIVRQPLAVVVEVEGEVGSGGLARIARTLVNL